MARPFLLWGLAVYAALLAAAWGGLAVAGPALWGCIGSCLAFAVLWRLAPPTGVSAKRAPFFAIAFLLAAAALASFQSQYAEQALPAQQWAGKDASIKARVLDYPELRYHRYYYRLRVEEVDKTTVKPFTIRLSASMPLYCEPYDWVECPVGFYAFDSEGLYSQQNVRLAGGYQLGAYLAGGGGTRIVSEEDPPGKALAVLRKKLARTFSQLLPPDDAGLLQAMLLGQRDSLLEEAYEDFRLIGCAHLLVVSGLHMGAVAGLAALLLRRTRLHRLPRTLLSAAVLAGYLCVTGFPISGIRAFIMCAVYLLGGCLGRRADSANSLGLALLLICLQDPFSGGDLSLALSAFATLGIVLLSPKIKEALLRPLEARPKALALCRPIANGLSVTLSVMVFTVPWQVLAFQGVSVLSPLANLLLAAPCTLLLYCALLALAFSWIPGLAALARPFAFCAGVLGRFARALAGALASVPRAYVYLGERETVLFLGCLLILLLVCVPKRARLRSRVLAGMLSVCLLAFAVATRTPGAVYYVADGDCIALVKDHEAVVLQVGERESDCVSLLRQNQVGRVTALLLEEDSAAARRSAGKVLEAFPTSCVLLPEGTYIGRDLAPEATGARVLFLEPGGRFEALPGVIAAYGGKSRENSSFTVRLADVIIYVDVSPGSKMIVREGS